MAIFQAGLFPLTSGGESSYRIECDYLTGDSWDGLAAMAVTFLPPFGVVEGVPQGGIPFANALRRYITPGCTTLLLAEDVTTTGKSLERFRDGRQAIGVTAFNRGTCPWWVTPVFSVPVPYRSTTGSTMTDFTNPTPVEMDEAEAELSDVLAGIRKAFRQQQRQLKAYRDRELADSPANDDPLRDKIDALLIEVTRLQLENAELKAVLESCIGNSGK